MKTLIDDGSLNICIFRQVYNYIDPASKLKTGCDYALFKKVS